MTCIDSQTFFCIVIYLVWYVPFLLQPGAQSSFLGSGMIGDDWFQKGQELLGESLSENDADSFTLQVNQ